jgi:aminocarboxymuconate-semialdehyde decarboxylase
MTIDVHAHVVPAPYLDLVRRGDVPGVTVESGGGAETLRVEDGGDAGPVGQRVPLTAAYVDPNARLAAMARAGVDVQVLSPVQFMYHYWLDGGVAAALARVANDGVIAMARAEPARFVAMATVPLQDATLAVAELERVHEAGVRSVEIGTHVAGSPLDAAALEPFWARAEALETVVFVHPYAPLGRDRLGSYYLRNTLGNPFETAVAAGRLIFGGVLERHTRLRVVLAHGGGALPSVVGRLDAGFVVDASCRERGARRPSAYLRRLWYDTITHDIPALEYLISRVGASRVMLGSDYPFEIGDLDPVRTVGKLGVDPDAREAILHGNAAGLLALGV